MDEKEIFFNDENFKIYSEKLKELILGLIDVFEDNKFEIYPEWRINHNVNGKKVFTFKAKNPRNTSKEPNIITIYPKANWLQVEVYHGEYDKHLYEVRDINSIEDELIEDAWSVYKGVAVLRQEPKNVENEKIECPFKVGDIVIHKFKFGRGKVVSIYPEDNNFEVLFENGEVLKKFKNDVNKEKKFLIHGN